MGNELHALAIGWNGYGYHALRILASDRKVDAIMKFEKWLQSRLNAHGAKLKVTGDVGTATRAAIKNFQRRKKIKQTGIANKSTVSLLRQSPQKGVSAVPVPTQRLAPWMVEMTRRMGLHEKNDKATLSQWLRGGKFLGDPSKLPWCGDAVETCIVKTLDEVVPENPFWAQGWKNWGVDAGGPICCAVAVIKWNSRAGHIGLVADVRKKNGKITHIKLRGGNQGNMVKDSWFPYRTKGKGAFIAFRWPKTFPITHYPYASGSASAGGGLAETR